MSEEGGELLTKQITDLSVMEKAPTKHQPDKIDTEKAEKASPTTPENSQAQVLHDKYTHLTEVVLGKNVDDFIDLVTFEREYTAEPIVCESVSQLIEKAGEILKYDKDDPNNVLTPQQYVKASISLQKLANIYTVELAELLASRPNTFTVRLELSKKLAAVTYELDEIGQSGKLKKFFVGRKINSLRQKKVELENKLAASTENQRIIDNLSDLPQKIVNGRKKFIEGQFRETVFDAVAKAGEFTQALESDEGLLCETNQVYANNILIPYLQAEAATGKITEEQLAKYYQDITPLLNSQEPGAIFKMIQLYPSRTYMLWNYAEGSYTGRKTKSDIFTALKTQMLQDRLKQLVKAIYPNYSPNFYPSLLSYEYSKDSEPSTPKHIEHIEKEEFEELLGGITQIDPTYLPLWYTISNSPTFNTVVGTDLPKIRKKTESYITDNSYPHEEVPFYIPEPDRVLKLILGTNPLDKYFDTNKSLTLCALSKRGDWQEIRAKIIEKYPEFEKADNLLTEILSSGIDSNLISANDINLALADLKVTVLTGAKEANPELLNTVANSADTEILLRTLVRKGITTDEQAKRLMESSNLWPDDIKHMLMLKEAVLGNDTHIERRISRAIRLLDFAQKPESENLLKYHNFIFTAVNPNIPEEQLDFIYNLPHSHPDFLKTEFVNRVFTSTDLYLNDEGIDFLTKFSNLYKDSISHALLEAVEKDLLTRERALEIKDKLPEAQDIYEAAQYPSIFLHTDEDIRFFTSFKNTWGDEKLSSLRATCLTELNYQNPTNREPFLELPQKCGWLKEESKQHIGTLVLKNHEQLLQTSGDIDCLNAIVGANGNKSDLIITGYLECLNEGVITKKEKEYVLEFTKRYKVLSPNILKGYIEAKNTGTVEIYIAQLTSTTEGILGERQLTDAQRDLPYFKDLIRHVYPNNSNQWANYEANETCTDRTGDLEKYKIDARYDIDTLDQGKIKLKTGEKLTREQLLELQQPLRGTLNRIFIADTSSHHFPKDFPSKIDSYLLRMKEEGGLKDIDTENFSVEQKLFLLLSEKMYGIGKIGNKELKELVIEYDFMNSGDASTFLYAMDSTIANAKNKDYAQLCQLSEYYSDRVKEAFRCVVEKGFENPAVEEYMKKHFSNLGQKVLTSEKNEKLQKLQVQKLGMSPSFITQAGKILERRYGRKMTTEEVTKIISRYESVAGGLINKKSSSQNLSTQAFYGIVRTQREKTLEALSTVTGETVDARRIHLGQMDLQEAIKAEKKIKEGIYDQTQFASYTMQRFMDLYEDERGKIDLNLSKFESESGVGKKILRGFITKSKESANARMVGGICVSGDNPAKSEKNIWDMENYLQLVLQDPETLQSQGLVLLHDYKDQGKRILTTSFNPSSTYLYSSDEGALFTGIMKVLEQFAEDNDFDMIASSATHAIRTNRTGGEFEKALDAKVQGKNKRFSFSTNKQFSYNPNYTLKDLDILWEKPKNTVPQSS